MTRRCSMCGEEGHRSDSAHCPARALNQDPAQRLAQRLEQAVAELDVDIAAHERVLETVNHRLGEAYARREQLVTALAGARAIGA